MKSTLFIPEQVTPHFKMRSLTISMKSTNSNLGKTLSKEDFSRYIKLYELAQKKPKKALRGALEILSAYPHQSELLNFLTYIYLSKRKVRKAEKLIIENYTHNPDDLLVKINYADYCIRKKRSSEILKIFGEKLDLRTIYPRRSIFDLAEFRGFMVVMGFYHLSIQKKDAAEGYFYLAHTVDKNHTSVQLLKKKLYKKPFYKKLFRIDRS